MTKMADHLTFGVSRSTIDEWFKLRAQTGTVRANTACRRGKAPTIYDLPDFKEFAQRHRDCTRVQMAQAWQAETGVKPPMMPFSHVLRRINWTRKKAMATSSATKKSGNASSGS